jgi:hypothetical protein
MNIPVLGAEDPVLRMRSDPIPKDGAVWIRRYYWENGALACAVAYNRVTMSLSDMREPTGVRDPVIRARTDAYPAEDCDGLVYEYYTDPRLYAGTDYGRGLH